MEVQQFRPIMFRSDHAAIRHLMGRYRLIPYAIFPGPSSDIQAVYVREPERPAVVLVQESWTYRWRQSWWNEEPEDPFQTVEGLRQEGGALAERLGCPVACVFLVGGHVRSVRSYQSLIETADQQEVTVIFRRIGQWPGRPIWIQPPVQVEQPALPPYPRQTYWHTSVEPERWLQRLHALADADPQQRKADARYLAWHAQDYLAEAPGRLLLEGPAVLAPALEVLTTLPNYLDQRAGQRYLLWTGIYLACAALAGHDRVPQAERTVLDFCAYLLDHFERWSNRNRRVILRGLEILARRAGDFVVSPESSLGRFLADLLPRLLRTDFLELLGSGWRAGWRLEETATGLAQAGYLPAETWRRQWRRHEIRGKVLIDAYQGLIDRLVRAPSLALWRTLLGARIEKEEMFTFRWHLYTNDFAPDFWALAAENGTLLLTLVKAALNSLHSSSLVPSPEALQRLTAALQQKLQDPDLTTWARQQLESSLSELLEAVKTDPVEPDHG